eukprot:9466946-Karenia_brevis.AAC.1
MPPNWTTEWLTKFGIVNFAGITKQHIWWVHSSFQDDTLSHGIQNALELYMKVYSKCQTAASTPEDTSWLKRLRS